MTQTADDIFEELDQLTNAIDTTASLLSYKEPLRSARELRAREFTTAGKPTLFWWQGDFYRWDGASYFQFSTDDVRAVLYKFLDRAEVYIPSEKKTAPFRPTRTTSGFSQVPVTLYW